MVRLLDPCITLLLGGNISQHLTISGTRVETDPMVQRLLSAGVITPIEGH